MWTGETSRRCAGEKGYPDICSRFPEQGKSSGRSSPSVSKSAIIEGRGWQGERRSRFTPLSPHRRGPPWSATQSPGLRPTARSRLGIPGEGIVQQMAYHFPSLPIPGFACVGQAERSARMKRSSYGERDYAFGQAMLSLRTDIGLTQAGLADLLGVSRRAVGEWEAGSSYPKAEHLKALLTLAMKQQAFPAGREEEEIRAFWKAA